MRQLTGQTCILCLTRIPSDIDGSFCRTCGSPVHDRCRKPSDPVAICQTCGASSADVKANREGARADTREAQLEKQLPGSESLPEEDEFDLSGLKYVAWGFAVLVGVFFLVVNDAESADTRKLLRGFFLGVPIGLGLLLVGLRRITGF